MPATAARGGTSRLALTPVGVGTSYSAYGIAQTCFLVQSDGRNVLLDFGSGAMNRLQKHVEPAEVDAVAISHLHPDHCVDLFSLRVYMVWGPGAGKTIPLYGPGGLRQVLVDFAGEVGWDEAFDFRRLTEPSGEQDLGDGLRLSWCEVPHSRPTFAMRLDWKGSSICFGADCGPNDQIADFARGVDVLILECSFGVDPMVEGVEHLNADEAGRIAAAAKARRLLITHCYPEHDERAVLEAVARHFDGPVEFARQDRAISA